MPFSVYLKSNKWQYKKAHFYLQETGKDGFTSDEDVFDISVGNDALSPTAGITPSVLASPTASLMSPAKTKSDSPIKSRMCRLGKFSLEIITIYQIME